MTNTKRIDGRKVQTVYSFSREFIDRNRETEYDFVTITVNEESRDPVLYKVEGNFERWRTPEDFKEFHQYIDRCIEAVIKGEAK